MLTILGKGQRWVRGSTRRSYKKRKKGGSGSWFSHFDARMAGTEEGEREVLRDIAGERVYASPPRPLPSAALAAAGLRVVLGLS